MLGVTLSPDQENILRLLHTSPGRTLVPSAHDTGKTFVAAVAACYWYDSFNPGLVLTTAPTERDVNDLLWTEIRLLRQRASAHCGLSLDDLAPKSAYMGDAPDHYAKGYVSRKDRGFQGRHRPRMFFVFDEANDVDVLHWITTRTMFDPTLGHAWLAIFNPTSTTSQACNEDRFASVEDEGKRWNRVQLSALRHPNVLADLQGQPRPIPGAITKAMVDDLVVDWCEPVDHLEDVLATDIEWPPGSSRYFRPGPLFQARVMGLWPDQGGGVWSPALWEACFPLHEPAIAAGTLPEIGVDCAQGKGADYHAIHARWGAVSLHHETSNTMDPVRIAFRIREVCALMANEANRRLPPNSAPVRPQQIRVRIDDDGTGNAIKARLVREGYNVMLVSVARAPSRPDLYPRLRDEAWFNLAEKARAGLVCFSRLDRKTLERLRQQLLAVEWDVTDAGLRQVERKDVTKEKINRSPDDADAANLAYLDLGTVISGPSVPNELRQPMTQWGQPSDVRVTGRQKMYGRAE